MKVGRRSLVASIAAFFGVNTHEAPAKDEIYAKAGEVFTCLNGHPLYRLTCDVSRYQQVKASQFERLDPLMPEPRDGERLVNCHCGQPWESGSKFHFSDGWRV